jgi:hypothetical protein
MFPNRASQVLPWRRFSGFALDGLDSRSIQTSSDRPGPSLHIQRLPHLLRLLLMYQDNPNRASASRNFFRQNRTCPADTAVLADFPRFLFWLMAKC